MNLIPVVIDKEINGERSYDIYSRLLKERIIFISGEINDNLANTVIAELLYLILLITMIFLFILILQVE